MLLIAEDVSTFYPLILYNTLQFKSFWLFELCDAAFQIPFCIVLSLLFFLSLKETAIIKYISALQFWDFLLGKFITLIQPSTTNPTTFIAKQK